MRTVGLWLLVVVFVVLVVDVSAAGNRKKKRRSGPPGAPIIARKRRTVGDALSLPCDFMLYDADADGYIDAAEVKEIFSMFDPFLDSPENVNLVLQELDKNGDGLVQAEEFYTDPDFQKDCLIGKLFKKAPGNIKNDIETFF